MVRFYGLSVRTPLPLPSNRVSSSEKELKLYTTKQSAGLDVSPDQTRTRIGEDVFTEVTDRLRDEPCVSFAFICEGWCDYSPELDVAVRLLSIAVRNRSVDHCRLIWGLNESLVTPETIASGKRAISECIGLLKDSGIPFEFLAHVEGESKIVSEYSPNSECTCWSRIADALADEVGELAR